MRSLCPILVVNYNDLYYRRHEKQKQKLRLKNYHDQIDEDTPLTKRKLSRRLLVIATFPSPEPDCASLPPRDPALAQLVLWHCATTRPGEVWSQHEPKGSPLVV